ncbi:YjgN family protein [Aurantibacillus circumpalustris]|uniref:YjgN family protein n=1 Tax=Aurantibacillus circumpalustris TaxID=3036359 RepID=UPI00295B3E99|nr:DUF898 family protein [Aurantibacillus circumpalustris]
MEIIHNREFKKLLKFNGDHSTLVGLRILNNVLKVITLGLYYPWARASVLQYMYGEAEYLETRFVFHGTGKEMFRGFIKALAIFLVLYGFLFFCIFTKQPMMAVVGGIVFYIGILLLVPLAIHGSQRYRLSRTSWRGIHFGYRGDLKEFVKLFIGHGLLSMLTLGIYGPWFRVKMKEYIYGNMRFGNIEFKFTGKGGDLFLIRLKGIFLSIITLGIYSFWFLKELVEFELKNIKIIQDGVEINMRSTLSAGKIFGMVFVNYLIVIFTLGLATGVAINRIMRVAFENIEFDLPINPDKLMQTEDEYKDATGDDLAGMLDIDFA